MCFGMTRTGQTTDYKNTNQLQNTASNQQSSLRNNVQSDQRQLSDQTTAGTSNQASSATTALPEWLNQAAQRNYQFAQGIADTPFQAYTGQRTADLAPDQLRSADLVRGLAGSGNKYLPSIEQLYAGYGNAPASRVFAPSILGGGYDATTGSIQDYLNPYIRSVLQPQLDNIERAGAVMRSGAGGIDSGATSAGAFGDARSGIERAEQMRNQAKLEADVANQAYGNAFDKAAALRGSDVANLINTGTANAGFNEQALARMLGAGGALQNLDQYMTGRGVELSRALNELGTQARQTQQQRLDAGYQEFLRGQQYPLTQLQALINSLSGASGNVDRTTTGATSGATSGSTQGQVQNQGQTVGTTTGQSQGNTFGQTLGTSQDIKTTYQPNNAGWGLAGSILGAALAPMTGGSSLGLGGALGSALGNGFGGGGGIPFGPIGAGTGIPDYFRPAGGSSSGGWDSGTSSGSWGNSGPILGSYFQGVPLGAGMGAAAIPR